jgi:uncharacterized protein (TIGR02246 family)
MPRPVNSGVRRLCYSDKEKLKMSPRKFVSLLFLASLVFVGAIESRPQIDSSKTRADEQEIRHLVDIFREGWNRPDGPTVGSVFTDDATFVDVLGKLHVGREGIAKFMTEILTGPLKGTKLSSEVKQIRFAQPDFAVALVQWERTDPDARDRVALSTMVFQKSKGRWKAVAFQNTPIQSSLP